MSALEQVLRGKLGMGSELIDYATAGVSGLIDGFLIKNDMALLFLVKNIAVPVLKFFVPIPKGMVDHSVGQLAMTAVLVM